MIYLNHTKEIIKAREQILSHLDKNVEKIDNKFVNSFLDGYSSTHSIKSLRAKVIAERNLYFNEYWTLGDQIASEFFSLKKNLK